MKSWLQVFLIDQFSSLLLILGLSYIHVGVSSDQYRSLPAVIIIVLFTISKFTSILIVSVCKSKVHDQPRQSTRPRSIIANISSKAELTGKTRSDGDEAASKTTANEVLEEEYLKKKLDGIKEEYETKLKEEKRKYEKDRKKWEEERGVLQVKYEEMRWK
ncbi:hypothetical protein O6P43_011444 [Quillaja saponaria]|uniref:Uncharacterized protein n=1 Tax=Quillaja saponaria TaxID=32244 RepID=A0AAD7LZF3_QUISA|nr:hypothetical protein O6P43_011444 [Quillaja saponaria]